MRPNLLNRPTRLRNIVKTIYGSRNIAIGISQGVNIGEAGQLLSVRSFHQCFEATHGRTRAQHLCHRALQRRDIGPIGKEEFVRATKALTERTEVWFASPKLHGKSIVFDDIAVPRARVDCDRQTVEKHPSVVDANPAGRICLGRNGMSPTGTDALKRPRIDARYKTVAPIEPSMHLRTIVEAHCQAQTYRTCTPFAATTGHRGVQKLFYFSGKSCRQFNGIAFPIVEYLRANSQTCDLGVSAFWASATTTVFVNAP